MWVSRRIVSWKKGLRGPEDRAEDGGPQKVAAGVEAGGETIGSTASLTHTWILKARFHSWAGVTWPQNGGRNDPGSKSQFFRRSHSLRTFAWKSKEGWERAFEAKRSFWSERMKAICFDDRPNKRARERIEIICKKKHSTTAAVRYFGSRRTFLIFLTAENGKGCVSYFSVFTDQLDLLLIIALQCENRAVVQQ